MAPQNVRRIVHTAPKKPAEVPFTGSSIHKAEAPGVLLDDFADKVLCGLPVDMVAGVLSVVRVRDFAPRIDQQVSGHAIEGAVHIVFRIAFCPGLDSIDDRADAQEAGPTLLNTKSFEHSEIIITKDDAALAGRGLHTIRDFIRSRIEDRHKDGISRFEFAHPA